MVFLKPEENSADGVGEADVVVTVVLLLEEGEGKAETVEEKRGVVAVEVDEGEDDETCTELDVTAAADTNADDASSLTRLLVRTVFEVGVGVGVGVGVEDA